MTLRPSKSKSKTRGRLYDEASSGKTKRVLKQTRYGPITIDPKWSKKTNTGYKDRETVFKTKLKKGSLTITVPNGLTSDGEQDFKNKIVSGAAYLEKYMPGKYELSLDYTGHDREGKVTIRSNHLKDIGPNGRENLRLLLSSQLRTDDKQTKVHQYSNDEWIVLGRFKW